MRKKMNNAYFIFCLIGGLIMVFGSLYAILNPTEDKFWQEHTERMEKHDKFMKLTDDFYSYKDSFMECSKNRDMEGMVKYRDLMLSSHEQASELLK